MSEFIEVDADLVADFCAEVEESLGDLESNIAAVDMFAYGVSPLDMGEYAAFLRELNLVEYLECFRAVNRIIHTVKGNSSFMGFTRLNRYCHTIEELTTGVSSGKVILTTEAYEIIGRAPSTINRFLQAVGESLKDDAVEIDKELEEIRICREELLILLGGQVLDLQKLAESDLGKIRNRGRSVKITIDLDYYDRIVQGFQSFAQETASQLESIGVDPDTLHQVRQGMTEHLDQLVLASQSKIQLSRYPRIVKDLSRSLNKNAVFRVNKSTALARPDVWDKCHNALVHMVRNAADHGIETAEARAASGKPATGTIEMDVFEDHKNIYVRLADDGKGIDPEAVAQSAVRKGVLKPDEAGRLTDEEKQRLIFNAGFSTREEATTVSGRGVGMDAVIEEIENNLGGAIRLDSAPGRGTTIMLEIPKAETLSDCILFGDKVSTYAIPNLPGVTYLEFRPEHLHAMPGKNPVYTYGQNSFPVLKVMEALDPDYKVGAGVPTVIRISEENGDYGFIVPEVKGHRKLKIERKKAIRMVVDGEGAVFGYGLTDPVIVVLDPEHLRGMIL